MGFSRSPLLKVSKYRKQILKFSFEPKNERNISALNVYEVRAEIQKKFVRFLVQMKTLEFAFDIYWPLGEINFSICTVFNGPNCNSYWDKKACIGIGLPHTWHAWIFFYHFLLRVSQWPEMVLCVSIASMDPMDLISQMPQKGQTWQEAKDSSCENSSRVWRQTMLRSKNETDAGRYDHDINCW